MAAGFFGKVPSYGDFVARRFPAALRPIWDAWLQESITASRTRLGAEWKPVWLSSPLWHFALGAAVAGGEAAVGVLIPSVDRVGRQFPLTIAQSLPADVDLLATLAGADAWFDRLDALARSALASGFDLDAFDGLLAEGPVPLELVPRAPPATAPPSGWLHWLPLEAGTTLAQGVARHRDALSAALIQECSFWWSEGLSEPPAVLCQQRGLPPAAAFVELLQGRPP